MTTTRDDVLALADRLELASSAMSFRDDVAADMKKAGTLLRSSPMLGREAVARIISDRLLIDIRPGKQWHEGVYAAADAILSLSTPAGNSERKAIIEECAKVASNAAFAARMKVRAASKPSERTAALAAEQAAQEIAKAVRALTLRDAGDAQ